MPARNEAERIAPLIHALRDSLPTASVLVVDDDSSDGTPAVAKDAGALVARLPFHLGYGGALQTGYRFAVKHGFDFVVQMDSDGQHRADDVSGLLAHVTSGECDLAIGSRFAQRTSSDGGERTKVYEMGRLRSIGRRALCLFARLGGLSVTDPTSGFQAMNRRTLQLFASSWYPSDYPDVDVLLLAHRRGLRLAEHPVAMEPSPRPSMLHSGWMPFYYAYRMMLSLWALSAVPRSDWPEEGPPGR
jgi:glycosyltransferase involved in cell wall biosynthesis